MKCLESDYSYLPKNRATFYNRVGGRFLRNKKDFFFLIYVDENQVLKDKSQKLINVSY